MIKLENKKLVQFFSLVLLFKIVNSYIFNYINYRFFKFENAVFEELSDSEMFFLVVILAPILETLISQLFLYRLLKQIGIKNTFVIIILMSIAFSLAHWYHWLYVVAAFFNGLLLNYFYVHTYKKKNELIAVLLTIALHSSYNLFVFLFAT